MIIFRKEWFAPKLFHNGNKNCKTVKFVLCHCGIRYGRTPSLDDLLEIANREYQVDGEKKLLPHGAFIDSGFAAQQVYALCAPMDRIFFPCKGWERLAQPVKESTIEYYAGRDDYERKLILIHFDDFVFKCELYLRRIQDRQGPPWHIARNTGADYIAQLTREKLVEKKNQRGAPEQKWNQTHRDNHWGDCEKMQLVARAIVGEPPAESGKTGIGKAD